MLVSICIPTYSRLNYLKQAVTSAKNQTYNNIEICISQNPKEDGADADIKKWCEQAVVEEKLTYNLNKENLGLTGNLNVLAQLAKGDYIIFLGDDDLLHPEFVSELINRSKSTRPDIIFCNQIFIDSDGNILEKVTSQLNSNYKRNKLTEGNIDDKVQCIFNNSVPLSAALIKKDLFNNCSFNENLNTPELPFFLRAALSDATFFFVNRQLAYYRLHKNSETNNGLTTDELLKEVITIQTPLKYLPLKRSFIERLIIPSINKAILNGNYKLARSLLKSGYYPNRKLARFLQSLMTYLPVKIVRLLFNFRKSTA